MAKYVPSTDDGHYYSNPIAATRLLGETIVQVENEPGKFDISTLHFRAQKYLEQVIGPRRSDEEPEAYKVRVFTELLKQCTEHHRDGVAEVIYDHRNALATYAKEALEAGDLETAGRWCSDLNANTDPKDPTGWVLYGTFCARKQRWDEGLECARKAIALDRHNRIALFLNAALLITIDSERYEEIDTLLDHLESKYPWFSEAHFLTAVHSAQMEMPDRTNRFLSLARRYVNVQSAIGWAETAVLDGVSTTVWDPAVDHGGDPALKCAIFMIRLGLSRLALLCLRNFARHSGNSVTYHYLMAVSHHRLDEFQACTDHLNAMSAGDVESNSRIGRQQYLLTAHNDHAAGRPREAETRFIQLSTERTRSLYGLVYSRLADYMVASRRYDEATNALFRACTVVTGHGTPVLLTKLGACLIALKKYPEAEKVLTEAVALDGAHNCDAWHYLAIVYARSNRTDMANACGQQAAGLIEFKSMLGPEYDLLAHKYH
ncbi:Tetratricopeptide repeat,Tetratricopeptide repeat-containing domain,Tetratricopeptide-like helical [Cinara cedri]|uniref:Tetratricopeptide repeat,Tetratricopeptide repeat-containing domain,Tetratricopeptide-like helical n=1 Tax=Cinara cedri TaxID=506608 RepID=A0A5E4LY95_9HEMI|nr:Tetratricopeptide repeat,Tetratricopeptide repeat-containing domain,Tetratricopeptide-like helical [Cinara cedri]